MTTSITIRNTRVGDIAPPSAVLSRVFRRRRGGYLDILGGRKIVLRGLSGPSQLAPYLVGASDNFESRNRLNWWSYGAFASKGQMWGNQYRAGRRGPPLLHK